MLAVAVLAAVSSYAWGGDCTTTSTTVDGVVYSGGVYTHSSTSGDFSGGTRTAEYNSDDNSITAGSAAAWQSFASNQNVPWGHTLHVKEDTSLNTDFSPFTLGGLIVDEGKTFTVGRTSGKGTQVQLNGKDSVNMTIKGDTTLEGTSLQVNQNGAWQIAEGKTLTLKATGDDGMTVADGKTVKVSGSGTLLLDSANTTLGSDSQISVQENAALAIKNSLTLASGSTLSMGAGTTLVLDNLYSEAVGPQLETSGLMANVTRYTLATGAGSVSLVDGVGFSLQGSELQSGYTVAGDMKTIDVSGNMKYVVVSSESVSVATVNETIAGAGAEVDRIQVDGTLTGLTKPSSGAASVPSRAIYGSGTVQVDGEFQYHDQNFLENFTGTVEILSGETHIGNQGGKFSQVSQIKLTGGALKGWSTTFAKNILLAGGTLSAANDNMTYSGLVTVTADSAIEGVGTGKTTTLSGTVNVTTGELTIRGNVTHSSTFDMSGPGSARYNGSMKIATGATFTSNANLWVLNTTNILLEEGGKFVKGGYNITGQASGSAIKSKVTDTIAMNNLTATNVTMAYSGAAATVSSTLAGSTTFKNTGSNLVTFSGSVGNDAVLEGVMGEDGVSNVKYTRNPTAGTGTIKNVNIENFDAGATDASIKMDGVVGTIRNSANVHTIELLDGGLTLTNANNFSATLKGSGNLVRSADNTAAATYTLSAAEWTGTFENGSATTTIELTSDTSATFETAADGHLVIEFSKSGDRTLGGTLKDVDLTGSGKLTLNGTDNVLKSVNSTGGALVVNGDTTVSNDTQTTSTIHTFMSLGADTALALTGKSDMVVAGTGAAEGIWMKKGSSITVDSTSTLTAEGLTFSNASITNTNTTEEVQIGTHSNKESVRGDVHISGNVKVNEGTTSVGAYTMENGTLNVASGTTTTVNASLTNMDMNVAAATEAKFGNVDVALKELTMAGGSQVTLGGDDHNQALKLTKLTVTDDGAAINANLNLTGATVVLNGHQVELGCSLTLGNTTLEAELPQDDTPLVLFTGVDSLTLGTTAGTDATTVDASQYFTNLVADTYNLVYSGVAEGGMVSIQKAGSVPEPTTGTLGLLALAGLMARRRRK